MKHGILPATVSTLVLLAGANCARSEGSAGPVFDSPSRVVEAFCEGDFQAQPARDSLVLFSPEAAREAQKRAGFEGFPLVSWTWDPVIVARSYKILSVEVAETTGVARVRFAVLARSLGSYRLEAVRPNAEIETLELRRRFGRWWIFNPPLAHVSVDAEIGCFAAELAAVDSAWFAGAASPQLLGYESQLTALKFLKSLSRK